MKKIFSIFCIALGAISFCACDSDDITNPYEVEATVSLVATDVDFDAAASSGTIVFSAVGEVTATSASDWCTTVVEDSIVRVSVTQNGSVVGRSTLVTLQCGEGSVKVPVTQKGVVFQFEKTTIATKNDDAQTVSLSMRSNIDLAVSYAPEWAKVRLTDDSVHVEFTANETGHIRQDYIKFESGNFKDSLQIVQADFDKDIAGAYTIYYVDDQNRERSARLTLTKNEIQLKSPKLNIPISYDPATLTISAECGQYCGKISTNYIFFTFVTADEDMLWSQYYGGDFARAKANYGDLLKNPGKKGNTFAFGGYFSNEFEIGGFAFVKSTSMDFSESTMGGSLLVMLHPRLERVIE